MSIITLAGATDVAEMALFSLDDLPSIKNYNAGLKQLEEQNKLFRLNTSADGSYSLRIYLEEQPPNEILDKCAKSVDGTDDF